MNVEDFFPVIAPELPDCPDEMMRVQLILTLQDFCRHTHAWSELQDQIPLIANVRDYEVDAPLDAIPMAVKKVWVNGLELIRATVDELDARLPGWQTAKSNLPRFFNSVEEWGVVRVYPTPSEEASARMSMRATFAPKLTSRTLPDAIVARYSDALAHGAKSRLMAMPNQRWTSQDTAGHYGAMYMLERDKAQIEAIHERTQGSMTVAPVRFG